MEPETSSRRTRRRVRFRRRRQARVLLVGIRLPPNYGTEYLAKFHDVFGAVARSRKLPLVPYLLDGFSENRELFQGDGIHPTAAEEFVTLREQAA